MTPRSKIEIDPQPPRPAGSKLAAYVQLVRLPNVFTALADVLMGYLFTHESLDPPQYSVALLLSSGLIYSAGMALNDVADVEVDRAERPARPLPSGAIAVGWARLLGLEMLFVGAALGVSVSFMMGRAAQHFDPRAAGVAVGLAGLVLLYNFVLKKTWLGPLAMGGCRFLNVLLGMSAAAGPWTKVNYIVAGGIGLYIVGVSWFARSEAADTVRRGELAAAVAVLLAGMAILAHFPSSMDANQLTPFVTDPSNRWDLLWVILGMLVGWRCIRAIIWTYAEFVEEAIKQCLLSIIMLDAVVCFAVHDLVPWTIVILALLVPTVVLGRWSYST